MSTSALLACLALLFGIANADPVVSNVSLADLGNGIGPPTGTFTPSATDVGSRSLISNVSFTFGAELYAVDATPVSDVPEPSSWEMMILGFVGIGLMPYLVARTLLPQPALPAFTVQSK